MSIREMLAKFFGFGLVALGTIAGGVLVFYGPHAYNDYFNLYLGGALVLIGLGVGGFGVLTVLVELREQREEKREHSLHITPRPGPLGPPPPWGMGDIGRVGGAVKEVGGGPHGAGGPRLMSVTTSNVDAPIIVGLLLLATLLALVLKAHFGGLDVAGP